MCLNIFSYQLSRNKMPRYFKFPPWVTLIFTSKITVPMGGKVIIYIIISASTLLENEINITHSLFLLNEVFHSWRSGIFSDLPTAITSPQFKVAMRSIASLEIRTADLLAAKAELERQQSTVKVELGDRAVPASFIHYSASQLLARISTIALNQRS